MSRRISSILLSIVLLLVAGHVLSAQEGTYSAFSPYSVFGVGDLSSPGAAYSKTMGGVGVAGRDHRHINTINPAAVTARDTLSFMVDISLFQSNSIYRQGDLRSAKNMFNINSFALSVPIWRKSAMMFGIAPYSSLGYNFSNNQIDPNAGVIKYSSEGTGGLYELYFGAGATFWKRISVGAQMVYHFGKIEKSTDIDFLDTSVRDMESGFEMSLNGFAGRFGVQYEQPIGMTRLTVGATYKTPTVLRGNVNDFKYAILGTVVDTVRNVVAAPGASLASEIGVGVSLRQTEHWSAEIDYTFSDWRSTRMDSSAGFSNIVEDGPSFTSGIAHTIRGGFEYIPNRNDLRYRMRRWSYRGGLYYKQSYFQIGQKPVNTYGLTFGVTIPVFQLYNGLTVGVDMGQRGSLAGGMIREQYLTFHIGISLHDIWFRKFQYE